MKCKVIARRGRVRLEAMLANGQARFNEDADQFYDTNGWVADEVDFTFDGEIQVDSNGIAFGGEYVFLRTSEGWAYSPDNLDPDTFFDSVEIRPEIA